MPTQDAEVEGYKQAAAARALELVSAGMLVGLGTGTTARYFIDGLGDRVRLGLDVKAVATSMDSAERARAAGILVIEHPDRRLDLAVDGADEIDPSLNCVKGRGGALLREKIVARASRRFVLIADEDKLVPRLGRGPLPVEVLPFLWEITRRQIESLGGAAELRTMPGGPFRSDNGNLVLDVRFPSVEPSLDAALRGIPGVLGHGLFYGLAAAAIIAGPGGTRVLDARS